MPRNVLKKGEEMSKMSKKTMKKIFLIMAIITMLAMCFTGCSFYEKSPEEEQQERLEAIAQEEAETGFKRADSPNLTDYEKPLQMLIQGIQENNSEKICDSVGSPHVLADNDIYGWILQNGYDYIQQIESNALRIQSTKENATATIKLYQPNEDPNNEESGQVFSCLYENGKWIIVPASGVVESFTFTSPTKKVNCGDVSLEEYAVSVDSYGKWSFKVPRMIVTDTMENFKLSTDLGEFDAVMVNNKGGYSVMPELIANMSEEQRNEYTAVVQVAFQSVFDMLKAGVSKNELSSVLVSEQIITECYPQEDDEKTALAENLATVTGIEVYQGSPQNEYPEPYVYRVYKDNGIQMDIKVRILTTEGECRKLATVTMQLLNGEWKISDIVCTDNKNLFTEFSVYNPAW